ncbi:T9SS type A sorting domain-containing protein [Polaribacter marinivivus]|uniref:T9SS type A sorting domain-containing protein n=1 Tax=Polaribacter marinivivus TaxID=1524260 RepID=A0ABV8R8G3_9FLAO
MKQKNFLKVLIICLLSISSFAQSTGDIAFVGFNAGGDSDFAIVALADISASTTIYFTDDETTGVGTPSALAGSEGVITWNSGSNIIKAGTIVIFTDVDSGSNASFGSSFGSITRSGSFNISGSKDGIIAFIGSDSSTPTTYIAAIQIGNNSAVLGPFDGDGITLTNTGLVIGSSIIVADNSASPNGGYFNGSRSNQTSYSAYYSELETNGNWTTSSSDGESLLPFSQEAFTINTTNWTGTTSSVWNLAGNWDNGIPTTSSLVTIPNVTNAPVISSGTEALAGNLTLQTGETLTINSGNALTVNGNLTITDNDSFILNSGSSLIVHGTSTGDLKYIRSIATTDKWYLVSSPVVGENSTDFLNNAGDGFGFIPQGGVGGTQFAIGTYSDGWTYNSANFTSGLGFTVKTSKAGDLVFTGQMPTSDYAPSTFDTTENYWVYGNPYPSFIPANKNADANNNILTVNSATGQDELAEATIWFWDQSQTKYITVNQSSPARYISPTQGFFLKTKGGFGDTKIDFKESMQSHQSTEVFNKSSRPEIKVFITNSSNSDNTELYYINGTSTGFDNGYDSSIFGGGDNSFIIYSGLVTNSQGEKLAIQSLPDSDYENMVIPIGINADSGLNIEFTIEALNLPNGINVYLEDRLKDTYTRLDETNSNYSITLTEKTNGFGRFYLHTKSSSALSTNDITLEGTNIYQLDKNSLRVSGINSNNASIKIYSILGKKVLDHSFSSKGNSDISLPNLNTGVYIVQVATEKGKINKKIVLK